MEKKIPIKNYIILSCIIISTIILTLFITSLIKAYKSEKLSLSPLAGLVEEVNINELDIVTNEKNEVILYVGFTNDRKVYTLEEKILKYIRKHDLTNSFLYLNVSPYLEGDKYLEKLKNVFPNISDRIKTAPLIIYIKDGKAIEVINNNKGTFSINELNDLNKKYEIEG